MEKKLNLNNESLDDPIKQMSRVVRIQDELPDPIKAIKTVVGSNDKKQETKPAITNGESSSGNNNSADSI